MIKKYVDMAIFISGAALAAAVFFPLTTLPVFGDVTYYRIAEIESYAVVTFALSALLLLALKKPRLTIVPAAGVWIALLSPTIQRSFDAGNDGVLAKIGRSAANAMREFAADLFVNVADFSWGGFVFLAALAAFTVSCTIRSFTR